MTCQINQNLSRVICEVRRLAETAADVVRSDFVLFCASYHYNTITTDVDALYINLCFLLYFTTATTTFSFVQPAYFSGITQSQAWGPNETFFWTAAAGLSQAGCTSCHTINSDKALKQQ